MLIQINDSYSPIILDVDVTGKETFKYLLRKIKKEYFSTRIRLQIINGIKEWCMLDNEGKCMEKFDFNDIDKKSLIDMILNGDTSFNIRLPIEKLIEKLKEDNIYCRKLDISNEIYSL